MLAARAVDMAVFQFVGSGVANFLDAGFEVQGFAGQVVVGVNRYCFVIDRLDGDNLHAVTHLRLKLHTWLNGVDTFKHGAGHGLNQGFIVFAIAFFRADADLDLLAHGFAFQLFFQAGDNVVVTMQVQQGRFGRRLIQDLVFVVAQDIVNTNDFVGFYLHGVLLGNKKKLRFYAVLSKRAMKLTLYYFTLALLVLAARSALADLPLPPAPIPQIETITVNGLIAGKAVVNIGGRHHIMRIGQKVGNVELLAADQYSALLAIDGEQKRFYLQEARLEDYSDDFIAKSGELNEEQSDILASNVLVQARSHIIKVDLLERLDDRVRFRIEYFYNASHGKRAFLRARTFNQGRATGYSSHGHSQLEPGRNLIDIIVMMNDKAPESYTSDSIKFEISGEKPKDGSMTVLAKYIPFEKVWQRQPHQAPKTVISSSVWQTGSQ